MIIYADTSALVKLVFEEAGSADMTGLLPQVTVLATAAIGYVELRAAVAAGRRDKRLNQAGSNQAKALVERLWARVAPVSVDEPLVRHAGDLAERDGLRGYDAVHLAALLRLGRPASGQVLACWDRDLRAAAGRHGYGLFPESV